MRTYGIAIVGTGNVARGHLQAIRGNARAELVALGARTQEGGHAWAAQQGATCPIYTDLATLLADPAVDIVILGTPNDLHASQTILAARAGKHIVIEKPVALNLAELRAMQQAVHDAGVITIISFVLHWNPGMRMARHLIESGALGRVFMVETCYWHRSPRAEPGHWFTRKDVAGGLFLLGGCHAVDAARWLAGSDIVEVTAYSTRGGRPGFDYDPTAVAIARFASGAIGRISATMECVMPYAFNFTVMGDQGTIRDNRLYSHLLAGQTDFATIPTVLPDSGDVLHHAFPQELAHLIACLDEGRQTEVSLVDVINTHEVCFAIDRSAAEGRTIRLPLDA
jgi:UDP-N-acetyl-2-amino-2-deoxyglucuronate dehydrogenase